MDEEELIIRGVGGGVENCKTGRECDGEGNGNPEED